MEITRINRAKIYVLSLDTTGINSSIGLIDDLIIKLITLKENIERKIVRVSKISGLIKEEELIQNAVFSEMNTASSDIKNLSSEIMVNMIDPISELPELQSSEEIDFRKNDKEVILSYRESPYYPDILDVVNFSKQLFKNVNTLAKKTVEKKDIEETIENDQSIFTVFLRKLVLEFSEINDLNNSLSKKKETMEDSLVIINKTSAAGMSVNEFYQLPDDEKIQLISG